ncbi:MAG: hypothetical protein P8P30_04275 [Rickettsiales bacterium]|nr:hypothetical protein [Rickettsiales bacterium]
MSETPTESIMTTKNATASNTDLESMLMKMASKGAEKSSGFKMPMSLAALKDMVIGGGAAKLSERGAPRVAKFAERAAHSYGKDAEQSARIGRMAENIWRSGIPLLPVIYESANKYRRNIGDYFTVGSRFSTALSTHHNSSSFFTAVNSDLEVVRNERSRLSRAVTNTTKSTFVHALSTLPAQIGTQLDRMISDVELGMRGNNETNKNSKTSFKKGKHQWSAASSELRKGTADKLNSAFDKTLDMLATESSGSNRKYSGFMNLAVETVASVELDELDDSVGRAAFLRNIKNDYFSNFISGGAAGVRKYLSAKLAVKTDKELKQSNAADMIDALKVHLKKNPSPVSVNLVGHSKKDGSLADYIADIFAQHQLDCERAEIPRRMGGNLKNAAEQISEAITDPQRQLDPEALILLVDKKHGISSFTKGEMTGVIRGEELDDTLAKLQKNPRMSRRKKTTAQKQYKYHQATQEQFVESWGNLTQEEKYLWSSFISDEILADVGVAKEEIQELRHQDNEFWHETMEEVLTEMGKLSAEELEDIGLSDSQVELLSEAVSGMKSRNSHYLEKNRHEMTDLVADAATLMDAEKPGFLKEALGRVQKRRDHQDILREKKRNKPLAEQLIDSRSDPSETRHK